MKRVLFAIVGEDNDVEEIIEKGFEANYPGEIVLITKKGFEKKSNKISSNLVKNGYLVKEDLINDNPSMEEVFLKIRYYSSLYQDYNCLINVDTDYYTSCLALSAAFVNGITAIGVLKDETIIYPIMKFSYYNALNEKKINLLKIIDEEKQISSMEELSKISNMSLPLIAYHLRGNKDSKGLIEMDLVNTKKVNGTITIELTPLGRLLARGGIEYPKH